MLNGKVAIITGASRGIGAATAEFFGDVPPPAQTLIGVTGLALPEFLIEIEATVVMDE